VKVAGEPELAALAGLPAVREVALDGSDGIQLLLEPDAPLSELLREIGTRVEVLDLQAESVTLHDIYLQTVGGGGGDPGAQPGAAAGSRQDPLPIPLQPSPGGAP
jgi:ABC-type uncharacterized transport system ATPase subunit